MINYLDRALLGVALPSLQKEFALEATLAGAAALGVFVDVFPRAVAVGCAARPLGVKLTYVASIALWSAVTLLHGLVSGFRSLLGLRLALGLAEAPCFPANSKIIAMWCPRSERARAVGLYTAAEYVGLGFLSPLLFWGLSVAGWRSLFVVAGTIGMAYSVYFARRYFDPEVHPGVSGAERNEIASGGGLSGNRGASSPQLGGHRQAAGSPPGRRRVPRTIRGAFDADVFPDLVSELSGHRTAHRLDSCWLHGEPAVRGCIRWCSGGWRLVRQIADARRIHQRGPQGARDHGPSRRHGDRHRELRRVERSHRRECWQWPSLRRGCPERAGPP